MVMTNSQLEQSVLELQEALINRPTTQEMLDALARVGGVQNTGDVTDDDPITNERIQNIESALTDALQKLLALTTNLDDTIIEAINNGSITADDIADGTTNVMMLLTERNDIDALQTAVAALNDSLDEVLSDIEDLQSTDVSLQNQITALDTRIDELELEGTNTRWYVGVGEPADSLGETYDLYLDNSTGDVYQKLTASSSSGGSNSWIYQTNIIGPAGPAGSSGATGATGPQGPQGIQGIQGETGPAGPAGSSGADGQDGLDGADGSDGIDGQRGTLWYVGTGAPDDTFGIVQDLYLDESTGDIYERILASSSSSGDDPGAWIYAGNIRGPQGIQGIQGIQGVQGIQGETGPEGSSGADGAIGPQGPQGLAGPAGSSGADGADGATGPQGPIGPEGSSGAQGVQGETGPQGPIGLTGSSGADGADGLNGTDGADGVDGTYWYTDYGVPDDTFGRVGDLYLDTDNGDVYERISASSSSAGLEPGAWIVIANLKGPQGDTGEIGETGSSGAQGETGPAGADGADGVDGLDGNRWYVGHGAPTDDLGEVDDFYLDLDTSDVYERILASSSSSGDDPGAWIISGRLTTSHNELGGLQGGTASEYYHLTSAQYTKYDNLMQFGEHRVASIDVDDYADDTVPIDRDQADIFELELGSEEAVIGNPTGTLVDGMTLLFRVSRPGGIYSSSSSAGSTPGLTFDTKFIGSTTRALPSNVLPTEGTADELLFCYHESTDTWRYIGLIEGFSLD